MLLKFDILNRRVTLSATRFKFAFIVIRRPDMPTIGVTSRCEDLQHVVFLDYDFIERWIVEQELMQLQIKFKLTPFYLFTTFQEKSPLDGELYGNYHAICLTKLPVSIVSELQSITHVDSKYKKMFALSRYKSWVLRVAPKGDRDKPTFLGVVGVKKNFGNEVSEAHLDLLHKIYPELPRLKYTNLDGSRKTYLTTYTTGAGRDVPKENA